MEQIILNHFNPFHRLCTGKPGIWLTRLRLGLSALNIHRFKYNFIDSPNCPYCLNTNETLKHYLFECPTHSIARNNFLQRLHSELDVDTQNRELLIKIILEDETMNPRNFTLLLSIVFEYLINSNRFH